MTWKASRDPLFRGDDRSAVKLPTPGADRNMVRHVLFIDGPGRPSPYLSTSEEWSTARRFAGSHGAVWETTVSLAVTHDARHIPRKELLSLMRGTGRGLAAWNSAVEVAQARRYVEEWDEHLLDFHATQPERIRSVVDAIFRRAR